MIWRAHTHEDQTYNNPLKMATREKHAHMLHYMLAITFSRYSWTTNGSPSGILSIDVNKNIL